MLTVTFSHSNQIFSRVYYVSTIWEAFDNLARYLSNNTNQKNSLYYLKKNVDFLSISDSENKIVFTYYIGIECYGSADQTATYRIECENEDDSFTCLDGIANSWKEVVEVMKVKEQKYGIKIVEIQSDT